MSCFLLSLVLAAAPPPPPVAVERVRFGEVPAAWRSAASDIRFVVRWHDGRQVRTRLAGPGQTVALTRDALAADLGLAPARDAVLVSAALTAHGGTFYLPFTPIPSARVEDGEASLSPADCFAALRLDAARWFATSPG